MLQFSESTGVKTFFKADVAGNITTQGLSGSYTPEQALENLLANTGVDYRFTDTESVMLVADKTVAETTPQTAPGSTTLKRMTVVGDAVRDLNDPYNKDYPVPNASTGTKTDIRIFDTPVSVQVVPKVVSEPNTATLK